MVMVGATEQDIVMRFRESIDDLKHNWFHLADRFNHCLVWVGVIESEFALKSSVGAFKFKGRYDVQMVIEGVS